ncbi:Myosin-1 [Camellia lanceoleosa]|uniref:Myosin-1 n=1 Tax=Camellia lanceoleosa TaxID=1840588 RepID=A0ACC0F4P4_9ERIC|nr:Myosin-1 [Camellia lanceoleosa]
MQRLESITPHFIRCIKPNNVQSPGIYEQELVLQQLRCCGVLEVVRISRSGFPTRMTHQKFVRRYGFLLLDNVASQDPLSVSVAILHQVNIFCLRCIKLATQNCFSALARYFSCKSVLLVECMLVENVTNFCFCYLRRMMRKAFNFDLCYFEL